MKVVLYRSYILNLLYQNFKKFVNGYKSELHKKLKNIFFIPPDEDIEIKFFST